MSARSVRCLQQIPLNTGSLDVIQWKASFADDDSDDGEARPMQKETEMPCCGEDSPRVTTRLPHRDSLIALPQRIAATEKGSV